MFVSFLYVFCVFGKMCLADAPTSWQMGFQDGATKNMLGMVDLHHDICFFLVTILVLVLWVGGRILHAFHHTRQPMPERFNHHTSLELVWAILPSLIIALIALPSLTLIYSFDDLADDPFLTVKVVGYQWAWRYEIKEHVRHALVDPDSCLSPINKNFLKARFSCFFNKEEKAKPRAKTKAKTKAKPKACSVKKMRMFLAQLFHFLNTSKVCLKEVHVLCSSENRGKLQVRILLRTPLYAYARFCR